ncbi:hypothetical protein TAMA11512_17990 [Selenomonas sp. TAMA-11512]|uniref:NfeD family protein n=1 Tax=Selenomonas sp. TAMA-11512 TaxID=3095337 RepID=UPI003086CB6F|nr:hypothetical protein TAMA11512_17990 [Selenomonas sp. TAMA-11512]
MDFAFGAQIVEILLLAVVFLAVLMEIKTGGMGLGALLGLVAAAVFFGSQYVKGLVSFFHIGIFMVGLICIAVEVLLPTVGLLGAVGVAALFYSFVLSLGGDVQAVYAMLAAAVLSIVIFLIIAKRLPNSKLWKKIVLSNETKNEDGYVSSVTDTTLVGRETVVLSDVRPAGSVEIDGKRVDVVSEGDYIVKGERVKIISAEGSRVVVRKV